MSNVHAMPWATGTPRSSKDVESQTSLKTSAIVTLIAEANIPSRFGDFRGFAFQDHRDGSESMVMVRGDIRNAEKLLVRVHSECFTGDIFGSLRCDCRDQLERALTILAEQEHGALIYLRQEGRGIGLGNKIRAYALQERGLDTVEANEALGFDDDLRDYEIAAELLRILEVSSIRLLTNNPNKIEGLRSLGVQVEGRVPLQMEPNAFNSDYLETKREKSGHLL